MISKRLARFAAVAVLAFSTVVMMTASFDAEARRMGGGKSFGRQSSNVMQQRQAVNRLLPPIAMPHRPMPMPHVVVLLLSPKAGFLDF